MVLKLQIRIGTGRGNLTEGRVCESVCEMVRKPQIPWTSFFAAIAILCSFVSCRPANDGPAALVVGMDLSYPPFEMIDASGKPAGVSVDLATNLGEHLGKPVRIENIPFVGLLPSLQSGKIDLIISSLTETEERKRSIAFSEPYLTIGLALLVGKDSPVRATSDLDQPGVTVAVRQGTTGQVWAEKNLKQAKVLILDKENAAVLEVVQGKADAFLYDQMSVWKNAARHPESTRALLDPLQREHWAVGLRLEDADLKEEVNAFLSDFKKDGGFEKLGEKWLNEQKEAFKQEGVEFYF